MLKRFAVLFGLILLLSVVVNGLAPSVETYISMQVQTVNGRPYLMLQHLSTKAESVCFQVYTPRDKNLEDWAPVGSERLGPVDGFFSMVREAPAPAAPTPPPAPAPVPNPEPLPPRTNVLGFFSQNRATILDISKDPPAGGFDTLPVDWRPETAAALENGTFAFGMNVPETAGPGEKVDAPLCVIRFDGKQWLDPKIVGPKATVRDAFWVQAVAAGKYIHVFWRDFEDDRSIGTMFEGIRLVTDGPLMMATFDGTKFIGEPVVIRKMPRGNTTLWSENGAIKALVQLRQAPTAEEPDASDALQIWTLTPAVSAEAVTVSVGETPTEEIIPTQPRKGFLPYLAAERIVYEGREYILRSNWQSFELWRKTEGVWSLVMQNPKGLAPFGLESMLLTTLAVCVGLVIFGAGLAYRRRQQALALARKVQANDLYASLTLRTGAFTIDLVIILAVTAFLSRQMHWHYENVLAMLPPTTFDRSIYRPFLAVYMLYMTLSEWLVGASPGKLILGLRVVRDGGQSLTFWSAAVRNMVGLYERLPQFVILVALPMMILGPRRQRVGDLLAQTYVVHKGALDLFNKQRAAALAQAHATESATTATAPADPVAKADQEKRDAARDTGKPEK